jgi:hypothetical protein
LLVALGVAGLDCGDAGVTIGRRQVLSMLAAGQVTTEEADRLITALESLDRPPTALQVVKPIPNPPRYLRVQVDMDEGSDAPVKLDVRVPLQVLRAGVRLASLIPPEAQAQVNRALRERGLPFDLSQVRPDNVDQFIDQLSDLTVAVDQRHNGLKIKLSCE